MIMRGSEWIIMIMRGSDEEVTVVYVPTLLCSFKEIDFKEIEFFRCLN